jgi:phosphohistidine phosphatase
MQIHLFSTPGEQGIEYIVEAARLILTDKPHPSVAYLPAACEEQTYVRETRAAFHRLARVKTIDVTKQSLARMLATLDQADLLYIPGGNTYLLAQRLHTVRVPLIHRETGAADMIAEIRQRVLAGLPLICFSAGSVLCGPDILSSNDPNDCGCNNFDGLDLLPFNLNIHFPDEPGERRQEREKRLQEFLTSSPGRKVWALEDGAYLNVANDAIRVLRGNIWEIILGEPALLIQPAETSRPEKAEERSSITKDVKIDALTALALEAPAKGEDTMKTLLILRHAKSSWKDEALPDHDRPLNKRGKEDAPRMGKLLLDEDLIPDLILSSDALRTRTTTELVVEESHFDGEIIYSRDLYAAESETCIQVLAEMGGEARCVMIVGHNPGLEELLQDLTGEYMPLPTAALAQVNLAIDHWSELAASELEDTPQGKLVNLWRPKEI